MEDNSSICLPTILSKVGFAPSRLNYPMEYEALLKYRLTYFRDLEKILNRKL